MWPKPPPTLTAKQTAVWQSLCDHGQPLEPRHLARIAKCGPGPIHQLLEKGLARRIVRRVESIPDKEVIEEDEDNRGLTPPARLNLNLDQLQAWSVLEPALLLPPIGHGSVL